MKVVEGLVSCEFIRGGKKKKTYTKSVFSISITEAKKRIARRKSRGGGASFSRNLITMGLNIGFFQMILNVRRTVARYTADRKDLLIAPATARYPVIES